MSEEKKTRAEEKGASETAPKQSTRRKKPSDADGVKSGEKASPRGNTRKKEEPKAEEKAPEEKLPDPSSAANQLAMVLLVVFSVFIGICYAFREDVGVLGHMIGDVLFGLFGGAAFLVPFLLLQMALFWRRDVMIGAVKYKYLVAIFTVIFLSMIVHTFYGIAAELPKLTVKETFSLENIKHFYPDGVEYRGGGFFGGLLAGAFICAVGYPGTILFGLLFFIGFLLSLFGLTPMECVQRYRFYRTRRRNMKKARSEAQKTDEPNGEAAEAEGAARKKAAEPSPKAPKTKTKQGRRSPFGKAAATVYDEGYMNPNEKIDSRIFRDDAAFGGEGKSMKKTGNEDLHPITEERLTGAVVKREKKAPRAVNIFESKEEKVALDQIFDKKEDPELLSRFSYLAEGEAEESLTIAQMEIALDAKPAEGTSYVSPETIDPETDVPYLPVRKPAAKEAEAPVKVEAPLSEASEKAPASAEKTTEKAVNAAKKTEKAPAKDTIAIRPPEMSVPAPAAEGDEDAAEEAQKPREYMFPPIDLLTLPPERAEGDVSHELRENADRIIQTLDSFNVRVNISNVSRGPTITRYEVEPAPGTRVRSITNLLDDIALSLATSGVRSDGIISGKSAIGIEVPNKKTNTVFVRELIDDSRFESAKSKLTASLGMDVSGAPVYLDIAKMPHLLIAGATGQGKSVCINSLIISLLYKARPDEVKFILIDPKKVELNVYNGLPHLLVPVVFDPKKAAGSLHWAVQEMERRFELIEAMRVRNIAQYNAAIAGDPLKEQLPQVVIIIDELADLMMSAPDDVETSICRLAQKARAAGMHLIIGTQRPSTDVITGLIKANIPSRIAFTVSNQIDSRIIIDTQGAEKLIGRGDMLFSPVGATKPIRVQGSFVSEAEIENIIEFIKAQSANASYSDEIMKEIERNAAACGQKKGKGAPAPVTEGELSDGEEADPMLDAAIELAVESGKISTSLIQRRLSLGYGRAAKLIDVMEKRGIVSPPEGQKPRNVLLTREQYLEMRMNHEDAEDMGENDEPPFDL